MLIAIFADIHANRPAFEACLAHAAAQGAQRIVLLGDYVGYGAAPEWVVDRVIALVQAGASAVLGNHDSAVVTTTDGLNGDAQKVIEWTRVQLNVPQQQFLSALPLSIPDDDRLFVHADASAPAKWRYITDVEEAVRSITATAALITVCGHVHRPALYSMSAAAKITAFTPVAGIAIPLSPGRRWLATVGAVGQPRDGIPDAAYALLDTVKRQITFCRVPYDIAAAAAAIRNAGLPQRFADRLFTGR